MSGDTAAAAMGALVSVVIPTRDRADVLRDALLAMLAQTHPALEIIVVDDGSGDHTADVAARAAHGDGRIRILRHEEPRGAAAARNAGARVARGRYLLFEDDDCRGRPDRVERLVRALEAEPDAAYAYGWIRRPAAGSTAVTGTEGAWSIGTPSALIRKEAFDAVGGFDEGLPRLQDFDLWTRILARFPAVEVPAVLYETVLAGVGISGSPERLVAASRRLTEKYRDGDLPGPHRAAMHRRLGGALLLEGQRREGLAHFGRALRIRTRDPRSWLGLAAAVAGPRAYRLVVSGIARLRRRAARGRGG